MVTMKIITNIDLHVSVISVQSINLTANFGDILI